MLSFLRGKVFAAEGLSGGDPPDRDPPDETDRTPSAGTPAAGAPAAIGTVSFVQSIGSTNPTPAGASAVVMAPVAAAGVKLALFVLQIATGSIILLLIYLLSGDLIVGSDVHHAYREVLNPSRIGSEFYSLGRLEKLSLDFSAVRQDASLQMSAEAAKNANEMISLLGSLPSVTITQKAQLRECVPIPSDASRNEKVDKCLSILETVRQAALEAASSVTNAQTAADSADKIASQRQAFHSFWLQAAQLVLLNLLLPLLTALFGYIFGTQQAQSRG